MADDLERLIRHYRSLEAGKGVILVGYSFGADLLPFVVNRLSPEMRGLVRLVALLGIAERASFEIRLEGILGASNTDGPETLPELVKMKPIPVLCVYGVEETDSVCGRKELDGVVRRAQLSGGHHFDGDYTRTADTILAADRDRSIRMEGAK